MYEWRRMTPAERRRVLALRRAARQPWHRPPHEDRGEGDYHVTAACYEHAPIVGKTPQRMADFEQQLLDTIAPFCEQVHAWCLLPSHYHFLAFIPDIKGLLAALPTLHGRTSYYWNGEDDRRGRKVWHDRTERAMRSQAHLWATLNYVLNNPVHHGYVEQWQDWPFSNAADYIAEVGREEAARIWREYPVLDYGKGWDDPDM
jgi:putative transposase